MVATIWTRGRLVDLYNMQDPGSHHISGDLQLVHVVILVGVLSRQILEPMTNTDDITVDGRLVHLLNSAIFFAAHY